MQALGDGSPVDPFDTDDYNPIDHLNAIFAKTSSLSAAARVSSSLDTHQHDLDRDIRRRMAIQRTSDAASVRRIEAAQSNLSSLFANIDSVQKRASETQRTITEMTIDIKRLDATKRNLTLSMTALKRLQMLSSAYEQLRVLRTAKQYRECAGLLAAVMQLMAHFKSYRSIEQIATLSKGVADMQREMLEQICEDFEVAFAKGEVQPRRAMLSDACGVIDALGDYARQRLVTWYCNTELREYRQVFRGSEEAGSLDNIGRRYSWFMRLLKKYDAEHTALFPAAWGVSEVLANTFCEGTRDDFKEILQKAMKRTDGRAPDVDLLLSALQETLDFEYGLEKKFAAASSRTSIETTDSGRQAKGTAFTHVISKAFEPYLSVWIESQERQYATLLQQYKQQPIRNPDEDFHVQMVMSSSTELFNTYRLSLAQCAKLSTGARLSEIAVVFAKNLDAYVQQVLLSNLGPGAATQPLEDTVVILNTADYGAQTIKQLEDRIRSRIDQDFKEKVDLETQADAFISVASASIRSLVKRVEADCEPAWREMRYIKWSDMDSVGDESGYMRALIQRIESRVSEIVKLIHKPQYIRAFCDNTVDSVITAFAANIVAARPISETGAEQFLLDAYGLKKALSGLLINASTGETQITTSSPANTAFLKRLNTLMTSKIEPLLKTLQVRASPPEGLVQAYLIHIRDSSEQNFRKLLDLKGIRSRQETTSLTELFIAHKQSPANVDIRPSNPILGNLNLSQPTESTRTGLGLGMAISRSSYSRDPSSTRDTNSSPTLPLSGFGSSNSLSVPKTGNNNNSINNNNSTASNVSEVRTSGRFDPAAFGSAIFNAARDGVDRLGTPSALGGAATALSQMSSRAATPPSVSHPASSGVTATAAAAASASATGSSAADDIAAGGGAAGGGGGAGGAGAAVVGQAGPGTGATAGINENLKSFGKFFIRREGSGFGGFGRQQTATAAAAAAAAAASDLQQQQPPPAS